MHTQTYDPFISYLAQPMTFGQRLEHRSDIIGYSSIDILPFFKLLPPQDYIDILLKVLIESPRALVHITSTSIVFTCLWRCVFRSWTRCARIMPTTAAC